MRRPFHILSLLAVVCCVGCTSERQAAPPSSTDTAEPAKGYVEAVKQALELRDTIRDGFAAGDIDAAHDPLHEIGHCLLSIPAAAEADLSADDSAVVADTIEELMDAFGAVDRTLHGGEGSTYEEEALTIDNGFQSLCELGDIPYPSGTQSDATALTTADPAGDATSGSQPPVIQPAPPVDDAAPPIQDAGPPSDSSFDADE